jgi:uncharacterized protein YndB with AHSA1/START domain
VAEPIIIEQVLNASAEKVWNAISDRDQMSQWYFDLEKFKPEVGFEFQFEGGPDNRKYLHKCKVTTVVPQKKLAYSWRYEGYPGNSEVTFELFAKNNQTLLNLTHSGLESFPASNPDFKKENFVEGWRQIIGTSLKKFIENA